MPRIETVIEQAERLELGVPFRAYRQLMARADGIDDWAAKARATTEAERGRTVAAIAAGEKVDASALEAAFLRYHLMSGPALHGFEQAAAAVRRDAESAARAAAPGVFDLAAAAAAKTVNDSVQLAATLPPDVRTDDDALNSSAAAASTWAQLGFLYRRWTELHAFAATLRTAQMVSPYIITAGDPAASWSFFREPLKLPRGYAKMARPIRLAVAHACGAGPGLFDGREAMLRRRQDRPEDLVVADLDKPWLSQIEARPPAPLPGETGPISPVGPERTILAAAKR